MIGLETIATFRAIWPMPFQVAAKVSPSVKLTMFHSPVTVPVMPLQTPLPKDTTPSQASRYHGLSHSVGWPHGIWPSPVAESNCSAE